MRRILLLLCLTVYALPAQAQDFWLESQPFASNPECLPRRIAAVSEQVVWTVGSSQDHSEHKWSCSVDGGVTWTYGALNLGQAPLQFSSMHATSAQDAYFSAYLNEGGAAGGIWATHDGGATWAKQANVFEQGNSFVNFVHFWDAQHGAAVGTSGSTVEIYTTSNAGQSWTLVPQQNLPPALAGTESNYGYEYEANGSFMMFATNLDRLFTTTDFGLHWTASESPLITFSAVIHYGHWAFKNPTDGLVLSNFFELFQTANTTTWAPLQSSTPIYYRNVLEYIPGTDATYFSSGEDENAQFGSSFSTNGGMSWTALNTSSNDPVYAQLAKFVSATSGYCLGRRATDGDAHSRFFRLNDHGALLKAAGFNTSGLNPYPNPTNGLTNFASKDISNIMVFDLSGKLLFQSEISRNDSPQLDLSSLQTGVYFAKTTHLNGQTNTFKILKND